MRIPFSGPKHVPDGAHVIHMVDHTNNENNEEVSSDSPQDAEHVVSAHRGGRHAIEVANGLVDVLYENQRGAFLCGIPLFSAAGLWVTDPHAWININHSYTPFTIFNATVPDPSWEWVWKRWFVDMSGDVDENGWSYNINFTRHHWHGHHMWYHAFVRRRRWLRKRRKVAASIREQRRLRNPTEDYYTTYSMTLNTVSRDQQTVNSGFDNAPHEQESLGKIDNLGDLYHSLRGARLDREKLDAVDNFLLNSNDLAALAGEMNHILRYMIFQESRKQLLILLVRRCQQMELAHEEKSSSVRSAGKTKVQCVQDAIDMAETLISNLYFVSDRLELTRAEEDAELDRLLSMQALKEKKAPNLDTSVEDSQKPNVESEQTSTDKGNTDSESTLSSVRDTLAKDEKSDADISTSPQAGSHENEVEEVAATNE